MKKLLKLIYFFGMILLLFACVKDVESLYISQKEYELMEIPTFSQINGLYFFNETTGFAVGDEGLLFKTIDGGKTWTQKSLGKYHLADIHFCNENAGYTVGWIEDAEKTDNTTTFHLGDAVALKTNDGGENWILTDTLDSYFPTEIFCIDENTAVIPDGSLVHVTEDGYEWDSTFFGHEITIDGSTTIYSPIKRANDVYRLNDATLVSIGADGGYITSDLFKSGQAIDDMADHISVLADRSILSTMEKSVYKSEPGNYRNLITEITSDKIDENIIWGFDDIEGISEDYFFIIVAYHIYRTKDGGMTWDSIIPRDGLFRKLQKINEKNIFGIGSSQTVYIDKGSQQYLIKLSL